MSSHLGPQDFSPDERPSLLFADRTGCLAGSEHSAVKLFGQTLNPLGFTQLVRGSSLIMGMRDCCSRCCHLWGLQAVRNMRGSKSQDSQARKAGPDSKGYAKIQAGAN